MRKWDALVCKSGETVDVNHFLASKFCPSLIQCDLERCIKEYLIKSHKRIFLNNGGIYGFPLKKLTKNRPMIGQFVNNKKMDPLHLTDQKSEVKCESYGV